MKNVVKLNSRVIQISEALITNKVGDYVRQTVIIPIDSISAIYPINDRDILMELNNGSIVTVDKVNIYDLYQLIY